ncbi:hypothetical protein ACE7GA_04595 [Roseomonas sp. CCTCC AB2023176]|uniref:hypothetical protein n=1 Tax=Roseomonas sp. CCTCC AB2023176 TaxID=3342640 RepID=UPI0035DAD958
MRNDAPVPRISTVPALFLGILLMLGAAALAYGVRLAGLEQVVRWLAYALIAVPVLWVAAMSARGVLAMVLGGVGLLAPAVFVAFLLDVAVAGAEQEGPVASATGVSCRRGGSAMPGPSPHAGGPWA